jgi:hypothetical protein
MHSPHPSQMQNDLGANGGMRPELAALRQSRDNMPTTYYSRRFQSHFFV